MNELKELQQEQDERMMNVMTLIKAPKWTKQLGHTVTYNPILGEEGKTIERYQLVLHADGEPYGCMWATEPSEFKDFISRWENTGKVYLPKI